MSEAAAIPGGEAGPYRGPDRRADVHPPPGGAAVTAAAVGAAAGTAAAKAVEFGALGMTGWVKLLGNATAMMVVIAFLFFVYRDFRDMVQADREYQRSELKAQREADGRARAEVNAELRALAAELRAERVELRAAVDAMRSAVRAMEEARK